SSFADLEKRGDWFRYKTVPLTSIHLHSTLSNEFEPGGNIQYIYIFIVIAVFIMVIACVNFMNLSTARSAGRSREVGVRKVMGSNRGQLVGQFLTESVVTSFLSLLLALILATMLLPLLNSISGKQITLYDYSTPWLPVALVAITFIVGLMAGTYPALFLSSFMPVQVLKGKLSTGLKGGWLRNSLVVFQFVAAIILIMGTLVIYSQLNYIRSKNLGYDREQVLVVKNAYSLGSHAATFKTEALQIPGITAGSRLSSLPTSNYSEGNRNAYSKSKTMSAEQTLTIADWAVDADYIPAMGMQIVAGRNFVPDRISDSNAMVINETAARVLGFKDPLTASLYDMDQNTKIVNSYNIIGIVKDFNAGSLRYDVAPVIMRLSKWGDRFAFRVKSSDIAAVVKQVEQKYLSMPGMAGQAFIYSFMDDDFNHLYKVEQQTGKIFISFAFFAILIACLGLFGLVSYATEQRTREIGIRKVLGAGIPNIIRLLSFDFVKLVLVATIVALPLGWIIMNLWLRDFAFRTNLSWWIFAIPALIALVLTLVTTSQQAIRAALINPVKSLKTE
ncbi:MAG: FtsX-like permease family protein, partial [Flavitalea sp.]